MEKSRNKLYLASAILEFVFAALGILYIGIIALGMNSVEFWLELEEALLAEMYGDVALVQETIELIQSYLTTFLIVAFVCAVVMFVVGAYFIKYSKQTDEEANENWGKCLAWVIVSYFFGGLLVGGLATGGLCGHQAKQRQRANSGVANSVQVENVVMNEDDMLSPENLEKLRVKLEKLKALKESGAITEEEFASLRAKVMHKEEKKEEVQPLDEETIKINKMTERLNKLNELKEAGALSEEEYQSLRNKVLNDK